MKKPLIIIINAIAVIAFQVALCLFVYKTGMLASDSKWSASLIEKGYAGYREKDGIWNYLNEDEVLMRMVLKYQAKNQPKPSKLQLEECPLPAGGDFIKEMESISLIPKVNTKK